jgi:hypothetical protein
MKVSFKVELELQVTVNSNNQQKVANIVMNTPINDLIHMLNCEECTEGHALKFQEINREIIKISGNKVMKNTCECCH